MNHFILKRIFAGKTLVRAYNIVLLKRVHLLIKEKKEKNPHIF